MFALNVYRAATQSITTDEAFTWQHFVSQPLGGLLAGYDANNHVLNSLLAGVSVRLFGLSEFTLRLPSVLAGAVYLFAARRLSRRLFGAGARSFLVTALLCTNPLLLDHLSAARGYGMALAFLLLAADNLLCRRLYAAGVFCGLAIAANLTSLFPVAGMVLAFLTTAERPWESFWDTFAVPVILVCFTLLVLPLSRATASNFYFGAKHLADTVASLSDLSLPYRLHAAVLPVLLVLFAACGISLVLRRREGFFPATLLATIALALLAHRFAGLPYPLTRTALYFVPLTILSAGSVVPRRLGWFGAAAGAVCLTGFLLRIDARYYSEWRFDAGTNRMVQRIGDLAGGKPVTVRVSWPVEPSVNFYRAMYKLNWPEVDRGPLDRPGDYWILIPEDGGWISRLHLRQIAEDSVSGEVLGRAP